MMKAFILFLFIVSPYWIMGQVEISVNNVKKIDNIHLALAIEINVHNQGYDTLIFNKRNEIIFGPILHNDENENMFEGLGIFLYSDKFDLIKDIKSNISVADIVYFDKRGRLIFLYLEGIDNLKVLNKKTNYYNKSRIKILEEIMIPSKDEIVFTVYVYLGKKNHIPNNLEYIRFYYKQNKSISYTDYYKISDILN